MKRKFILPILGATSCIACAIPLLVSCNHTHVSIDEAAKTQNAVGNDNIATYELTLDGENYKTEDFTINTPSETNVMEPAGWTVNGKKLTVKVKPTYGYVLNYEFDMEIKTNSWTTTIKGFKLNIVEKTPAREWFTKYYEFHETFVANWDNKYTTISIGANDTYLGKKITKKRIEYIDHESEFEITHKKCIMYVTNLDKSMVGYYVGGVDYMLKVYTYKELVSKYKEKGYTSANAQYIFEANGSLTFKIEDGTTNDPLYYEKIHNDGYTYELYSTGLDQNVHFVNTYSKE